MLHQLLAALENKPDPWADQIKDAPFIHLTENPQQLREREVLYRAAASEARTE